jgi:hypothetical protein
VVNVTYYNTPGGSPVLNQVNNYDKFSKNIWKDSQWKEQYTWQSIEPANGNHSCAAALYNPASDRLTWVTVDCEKKYHNVLPTCEGLHIDANNNVTLNESCPKFYVGFKHPKLTRLSV